MKYYKFSLIDAIYSKLLILLTATFFFSPGTNVISGQSDKFLTYYEKNNYNHTPRYNETIEFCQLLANNSPLVTYRTIGVTPQGRDIPLLILDRDGFTDPQQVRAAGRVVILVQAAIHAGEPDGKDAGMMLVRDIAIHGKYPTILDNVSLLFIPIINPDGHEDFGSHYRINQNGPAEVGSRFTAQRLNLNRDFIKADADETRAFLKLYTQWMPEIFIDIHVTNGADFQYVTTYGIDHCGFMSPPLQSWTKSVFETELNNKMLNSGYPIFPYFEFSSYTNPGEGLLPDNFPPQYSNGYASANNRVGLLVENHVYKPYKQRVNSAYLIIKHSMEIAGQDYRTLISKVKKTDSYVRSYKFRTDSLPLNFSHDRKESILVDFLTWEQKREISQLSGAEWIYSDREKPVTVTIPLFVSYKKELKIKLPEAYLIPREQIKTIELLDIHGIDYERLKQDSVYLVETYRFVNPKWSEFPYEGRTTLNTGYTTQNEMVKYRTGDIIVTTNQPKVKIIAHLLEPKSPTSLVYWGFYNLYARPSTEFWIRINYMEVKGRELLENNPEIREEFELKRASDPSFASDPNRILQFFMSKVRENVETDANRYPVSRLMR